jgi:large subunit ribosomal protein L35
MGKNKIKTHQATKKRFRKTGSGKIMRTEGHHGHLRRRKSSRAVNELKKMHEVEARGLKKKIKRLAPDLDR